METQTSPTSAPSTPDTANIVAAVADKIAGQPDIKTSEQPITEEPKKEESISSKFAALAKRQKAIEAEKARIKAEKAQIEAEKAELEKWKAERSAPKKKLNPIEALMDQGYTLAEANEFFLNNEQPTADHKVKRVETELEALRRELKEKEEREAKEIETKQKEAEEKALQDFKGEISSFVESSGEEFELVKLFNASQTVFETIDQYYQQNNKVLSIKEAAQLVETYLEEELERVTKTKKYQSKYASKPKEEEKKDDKPVVTTKTLSNTATSSPASVREPAKTEEERRRRALEILSRS